MLTAAYVDMKNPTSRVHSYQYQGPAFSATCLKGTYPCLEEDETGTPNVFSDPVQTLYAWLKAPGHCWLRVDPQNRNIMGSFPESPHRCESKRSKDRHLLHKLVERQAVLAICWICLPLLRSAGHGFGVSGVCRCGGTLPQTY